MAYWLLKTEPSTYSFEDLQRERRTRWDGVRNAAALLNIRAMRPGDRAIIYHSGDVRAGVGLAEVVTEPYRDPEGDSDKWTVVDVQVLQPLARPVTLAELKANAAFEGSPLLRISRLSVVPLTDGQFAAFSV